MRVELQGLQNATYNGKTGVLCEYIDSNERWKVQLDEGGEILVKEENIKRLIDASVAQALRSSSRSSH